MNRKKSVCVIFIMILISMSFSLWAIPGENMPDEEIFFRWALVKRDLKGDIHAADTAAPVEIAPGELIKFYLKPLTDSSIYLIHHSSEDELEIVFIYKKGIKYPLGKDIFIPHGPSWLSFGGEEGMEKYYLLASRDPLLKLEGLIKDYISFQSDNLEDLVLDSVKNDIHLEIKRLFITSSNLQAEIELPLSYAGTIRGGIDSIEDVSYEVKTKEFYGKTIRIIH